MGAKKWRKEYSESLRGLDVIISPDNDPKGWEHAEMVARALIGIAKSVKIIRLPNLKGKQDISDWFDQGGTVEELNRLVNETPDFKLDVPTESEITQLEEFDTSIDPTEYRYTDVGNAEMFIEAYGHMLRCTGENGWYYYDGKRWKQDGNKMVLELAKRCNQLRFRYAATLTSEIEQEARNKLLKHAMKSDTSYGIRACMDMSQSNPTVACSITSFDQNPYLLNAQNGTLDLRDGQLNSHDPDNLITKIVNCDYDPKANCSQWLKFQKEISGDTEVIGYKQRLFGYALTGDISEQVFSIHHGFGSNGKSTELNTLEQLLGDYAATADFDSFTSAKSQQANNEDIARLRGARFVIAIESEQSKRLNEALIKKLTGGEKVLASFNNTFAKMSQIINSL